MQFMTVWKIRSGCLESAAKRFLASGAPPPEGAKLLGRWHAADFSCGFSLVETDDPLTLAHVSAEWGDLLELQSHVVIGDEAGGAVLAKHFGA